jgi:hypothetical protein
MAIKPRRVLDIGMGYGRWGMLIREFGELWFDRVERKDWMIHVEGVEAFEQNIDDYQPFFYNRIHNNDFRQIYRDLPADWDLIIFGDVLEHFERDVAEDLLRWATGASSYVLINIPLGHDWPQEDLYENKFERHLSEWEIDDFKDHSLIRFKTFFDFQRRPFGSFILSKNDPENLRKKLFSYDTAIEPEDEIADDALLVNSDELVSENNFLRTELDTIKASVSYRVANKLAHSALGKLAERVYKKKS